MAKKGKVDLLAGCDDTHSGTFKKAPDQHGIYKAEEIKKKKPKGCGTQLLAVDARVSLSPFFLFFRQTGSTKVFVENRRE